MGRYEDALHRMQSAIAYDMTQRGMDADGLIPITDKTLARELKHHRVGIDSCFASADGLVRLLVEKGVLTRKEYTDAMTVAAEREADHRVALTKRKHGLPDVLDFA